MNTFTYTRLIATGILAIGTMVAQPSQAKSLTLNPSALSGKATVLNVKHVSGLDSAALQLRRSQQQQQQQQQQQHQELAAVMFDAPASGFTL